MKSETQIRIIESRNRYFQELKKQICNESVVTNTKIEPPAEVLQRPRESRKISLQFKSFPPIPFRTIRIEIQRGAGFVFSRSSNYVSSVLNSISDAVSKRTEKTRGRIFSFLVVLFDAENS